MFLELPDGVEVKEVYIKKAFDGDRISPVPPIISTTKIIDKTHELV